MDEDLIKSLLKRAKGYRYNEVQEEYSVKEDGDFVLTKKKIVKKYCPPDSSALKTYLDIASIASTSERACAYNKICAELSDTSVNDNRQKTL